MINGIIGRKIGMTQIFAADGSVTPVTVIKAGPCVVVQKKSASGPDGYDAVQIGLVDEKPQKLKNVTKPMRGSLTRVIRISAISIRIRSLKRSVRLYSSIRLLPASSVRGPHAISRRHWTTSTRGLLRIRATTLSRTSFT